VASVRVNYRYAAKSTMGTDADHPALGLASTGTGTFLDGYVDRADVVAAALLRVGDVAATTRLYVHPSLIRAQLLLADPIVTVGTPGSA
jgi:hypothetical protein